MKKLILPLAALTVAASAFAQNDPEVFNYESDMLDGFETPMFMFGGEPCLFRVSDNGQYAVGVEYESFHASFMWTNETNTVEWLNTPISDKNTGITIAYDVANDGTVAGASVDDNLLLHPAIKPLGCDWIQLPMPEDLWYTKWNYKQPDYASVAKRISSDGKTVCGYIYVQTAEGKLLWWPILWKLNDNNEVIETVEFRDAGIEHVFQLYDMSDDGSVIVGMYENERGEQLPAYIKDGKISYFAAPVLTECNINKNGDYIRTNPETGKVEVWAVDGDTDRLADVQDTESVGTIAWELDENGFPYDYYWGGGVASFIDDDFNVYYYYSDQKGLNSIVENIKTGEKKYYGNDIVACGTRGMVIGGSLGNIRVLEGPDVNVSGLASPQSIADDATVIAGGNIGSADGNQFNFPALLIFDESPLNGWVPNGVKAVEIKAYNVAVEGGVLNIAGEFEAAELYDAAGRKVAEFTGAYDMNGLANGLYIVKIQSNGTNYVQKVVK